MIQLKFHTDSVGLFHAFPVWLMQVWLMVQFQSWALREGQVPHCPPGSPTKGNERPRIIERRLLHTFLRGAICVDETFLLLHVERVLNALLFMLLVSEMSLTCGREPESNERTHAGNTLAPKGFKPGSFFLWALRTFVTRKRPLWDWMLYCWFQCTMSCNPKGEKVITVFKMWQLKCFCTSLSC